MKRIKDYFLEDENLQCGVFTHENPYTKVMIKRYNIDSYNIPKGYIFDNDSGKRILFYLRFIKQMSRSGGCIWREYVK